MRHAPGRAGAVRAAFLRSLSTLAASMARIRAATGGGPEFAPTAVRAEEVGLPVPIPADHPLALDRHAAHRVGGHRHHVLEGAILDPQHAVGGATAARVVADG